MSWLSGMASVFDLGATFYHKRIVKTEKEAMEEDAEAIASDWRAVGDDLRRAMKSEKLRTP